MEPWDIKFIFHLGTKGIFSWLGLEQDGILEKPLDLAQLCCKVIPVGV